MQSLQQVMRRRFPSRGAVLGLAALATLAGGGRWVGFAAGLTQVSRPAAQSAGLKIVVLEGEGAVNIIQQKTAVAPVVEVRDRNDQPVAGVMVRFVIQGGRATFGGARTLTLTTNAAGRAAVTGLTPTASGAFQISASAAFQGQTAVATIAQTNVLTTAQAATAASGAGGGAGAGSGGAAGGAGAGSGGAAGGAGAGSGGGISASTVGIAAGAVAGGALVATKALHGDGKSTATPGIIVTAGTWSYAIAANVPLNSGLGNCVSNSSGTTLVSGSGVFSIPFAGLTCSNCSMSGAIAGTIVPTGVSGNVTASISGPGCSSQQPTPAALIGTCTTTVCSVSLNSNPPPSFGLTFTLTPP